MTMNSLQELADVYEKGYKKGIAEGCPRCLECNEVVVADEGCYCVPCSSMKEEDDNPEDTEYETPRDEAIRRSDEGHYEEK